MSPADGSTLVIRTLLANDSEASCASWSLHCLQCLKHRRWGGWRNPLVLAARIPQLPLAMPASSDQICAWLCVLAFTGRNTALCWIGGFCVFLGCRGFLVFFGWAIAFSCVYVWIFCIPRILYLRASRNHRSLRNPESSLVLFDSSTSFSVICKDFLGLHAKPLNTSLEVGSTAQHWWLPLTDAVCSSTRARARRALKWLLVSNGGFCYDCWIWSHGLERKRVARSGKHKPKEDTLASQKI
jgi:hypothetical protein